AELRRRLPARLDSDATDAVAALGKSRALTDEARAALVAVVSRLAEEGREREAVAT
ncbi:F0F1 ATP synthase subunit alpha, partial [bacterium]|nr:F0F1 ATP synthase subunit alpha [bacterium]